MRRTITPMMLACLVLAGLPWTALGDDQAAPVGDPEAESPTLHCIGVAWLIAGDDNRNAHVDLSYRAAGSVAWNAAMPLFRVERGASGGEAGDARVVVPAGTWLFAGSIMFLDSGAEYELRLSLADPDGGTAERTLLARTAVEPMEPANARVSHVVPGNGGGSGSLADPYRGLAEAQRSVSAGTIVLVHAGVYWGTFEIQRSGEPGSPTVWRGAGDGPAVIDGRTSEGGPWGPRGIWASDAHDVWFEDLTIRNADWGLVAHDAARVVVRRCRFENTKNGITSTRNSRDDCRGLFISDNVLQGPLKWPRAEGVEIEEDRGIQVTGSGHVVCYNRISGFKDGIDTFPSSRCEAIDIHNNDISECLDDGTEMDGSYRNTRCFLNRYTNVFQGISTQPVYGGPVYIVRNVLYNVQAEPLKLHNSPSGAIALHNTCVKQGMPEAIWTTDPVRNCVFRNNLFVGTDDKYTAEFLPPMVDCDFDYDGFALVKCTNFLKWNDVRYPTIDDVRASAPVERHATVMDAVTLFASGLLPPADYRVRVEPSASDARLAMGTAAVDAGEVLPGVNDGFAGQAPDLGALELGADLPHYGPRTPTR